MSVRYSTIRPGWDDPAVIALRKLIGETGGLSVFASAVNGRVPASLINAGLIEHPDSGRMCLAHVALGNARRLPRLAAAPGASVTFNNAHRWLTAEGVSQLVFGPWDERAAEGSISAERYTELLREIYRAAGGAEHPDWAEYDRVMREQSRTCVLVEVDRIYGLS